jgi:hypothetical protein
MSTSVRGDDVPPALNPSAAPNSRGPGGPPSSRAAEPRPGLPSDPLPSEGRPADRQGADRPVPRCPRCPTGRPALRPARESPCAKFRVLAAPTARERHPELVGRGPRLNQPGQAAASRDLRLIHLLIAGSPNGTRQAGANPDVATPPPAQARREGEGGGRRRCQHSGGSIGAGHAERVWRWGRVGVVARTKGVPRHGRC